MLVGTQLAAEEDPAALSLECGRLMIAPDADGNPALARCHSA